MSSRRCTTTTTPKSVPENTIAAATSSGEDSAFRVEVLTIKEDNDQASSFNDLGAVEILEVACDGSSPKNQEAQAIPRAPEDENLMLLEDKKEVKSFKDLGLVEQLVEACDSLGWKNPSEIQAETIPHALQGKDLVGLAQTGSGKSGAFALPILQDLLQSSSIEKGKLLPPMFACVLCPLRERAFQVAEHFEGLGSAFGVKCAVLAGGASKVQEEIAIAKLPHIIAATPWHLKHHLSNTSGFSLKTLKYLVLDEADQLLNQKFEKYIDDILMVIPRERTTYLFSATMTRKVQKFQSTRLRNPVMIETASKHSTVFAPKEQYLFIPNILKDYYLLHILNSMSHGKSMVFTRTRNSALLLYLMLKNLGFRAVPISSHMTQEKRLKCLNKFKAGECNIIVCSDVANRGLDVPSVTLVVNYDLPANSEDYFHRVERMAWAGQSGLAISMVDEYELQQQFLMENYLGVMIPEFPFGKEEVELYRERIKEAKRISQMKVKEIGCIKRKRLQKVIEMGGGKSKSGEDMTETKMM